MKGNRTNIITFTRQLRPQPPYYAKPYFWGIDTLTFHDKRGKVVWEQQIPEASNYFKKGFYDWLETPRHYIFGCGVKRTCKWGWIIEFELTHEEAAKIWDLLFRNHPEISSQYDKMKGQFFTERKKE